MYRRLLVLGFAVALMATAAPASAGLREVAREWSQLAGVRTAAGAVACLGKTVTINGTVGDDVLTGTPGNDVFSGGDGNDTFSGGDGHDTACGGNGNDTLNGDNGNDRFSGGPGNDAFNGGFGTDGLFFPGATRRIVYIANPGTATGQGTDSVLLIEAVFGTPYNDSMTGSGLAELFVGGGGKDSLNGAANGDLLDGGKGNDILRGGPGFDGVTFFLAPNGVLIDLRLKKAIGWGTDQLLGIEAAEGSKTGDTIVGTNGPNDLHGGPGHDVIRGLGERDGIWGGRGNDEIFGGTGHDQLYGEEGRDYVDGNAGNDLIYGGPGEDRCIGELKIGCE